MSIDLRVEEIAGNAEMPLRFGVIMLQLWPARNSILSFADVHPEQAEAGHEGAVGNAQIVAAAGAVEVEFVVADEVRALPVAIDAEAEAGVLRAEVEFA